MDERELSGWLRYQTTMASSDNDPDDVGGFKPGDQVKLHPSPKETERVKVVEHKKAPGKTDSTTVERHGGGRFDVPSWTPATRDR